MAKDNLKPSLYLERNRNSKILILGLFISSLAVSTLKVRNTDQDVTHSSRLVRPKRPFQMPLKGNKFEIFQPLYDKPEITESQSVLFAPQTEFVKTFLERVEWARPMVTTKKKRFEGETPRDQAVDAYLQMMISVLSGISYNDADRNGRFGNAVVLEDRKGGLDWPLLGDTMVGYYRLQNIKKLLKDVIDKSVPGAFMETGVWRGGSSIFARAVMDVFGENHRLSFVCDSFHGLPPGDKMFHETDRDWTTTSWIGFRFLEVPSIVVGKNFQKYGLLSENVIFAKGFFNETMPPLSSKVNDLAILRLDGDMYESTVDVLYHMYGKVSVGGYVIIDDWNIPAAVEAVNDFMEVHGIAAEIIPIDTCGVYFQKSESIDVQYWRYEQSKFK